MPSSASASTTAGLTGVGRSRPRRSHLDAIAREVGEVGSGHLGPPRIVDADEEHARAIQHADAPLVQQAPADETSTTSSPPTVAGLSSFTVYTSHGAPAGSWTHTLSCRA